MPNYKVHLIGGGASFLLMSQITSFIFSYQFIDKNIIPCFAICLLGSIFPDIDIHSKMQKMFFLMMPIVFITTIMSKNLNLFFAMAGMVVIITIIKHRTLTHQAWFLIAIPGLAVLYVSYHYPSIFDDLIILYVFFIGGGLSHIFLDKVQTKFRKLQ
jgi:hypothetical protein